MHVGVVEDDPLYVASLQKAIDELPFVSGVRFWGCAEEFWKEGRETHLDVLLLDIALPGMSGIELAGLLSIDRPQLSKVILTTLATENLIFDALRFGCIGYLLKSELDDLGRVLTIVRDGGAVISPTIAVRVLQSFNKTEQRKEQAVLSLRERQVLEQLAQGYNPAKTAELMQISVNTVRSHIKKIYEKLNVNSRQELMKKAAEMGLLR